jgi:hypothetical protein
MTVICAARAAQACAASVCLQASSLAYQRRRIGPRLVAHQPTSAGLVAHQPISTSLVAYQPISTSLVAH